MHNSLAQIPVQKLLPFSEVTIRRRRLETQGKRVVLTNGCFDLLHAGHIHFLQEASRLGDALIVGLNSDKSVKSLKGPMRPIQSERERAMALSALECTSLVFVFDQRRLAAEIRELRPDSYAKAGDYSLETLDASERTALQEAGTKVHFLSVLRGFSTTELIKRVVRAGGSVQA